MLAMSVSIFGVTFKMRIQCFSAFLGLFLSASEYAYFAYSSHISSIVSDSESLVLLCLCPAYLACAPLMDGMQTGMEKTLVSLLVGVVNALIYAVIGTIV